MKKTNKGFTLVELIIVIAVIGVLAAILIPVFSNVIDKANQKSAYSDAKNAVTKLNTELIDGENTEMGDTVLFVKKGNKVYAFGYKANEGAVVLNQGDGYEYTGTTDADFENLVRGTIIPDLQSNAELVTNPNVNATDMLQRAYDRFGAQGTVNMQNVIRKLGFSPAEMLVAWGYTVENVFDDDQAVSQYAATVNGTTYTTLDLALNAVNGKSGTFNLKLLKNGTMRSGLQAYVQIIAGSTLNLDLNGKTLTYGGTSNTAFYVQGTMNVSGNGTITYTSAANANFRALWAATAGKINVNGATLMAKQAAVYAVGTSEVVINSGHLEATTAAVYMGGTTAKLTVNGGDLIGTTQGIYLNSSGNTTTTINGGTITAGYGIITYNATGNPTINMTGGTINTTVRGIFLQKVRNNVVNVSGGEINTRGDYCIYSTKGEINISGGTIHNTCTITGSNAGTCVYPNYNYATNVTVSGDATLISDYGYGVTVFDNSTFTMTGGTIRANYFAVCNNGSDAAPSTMTISGGSLYGGTAIYHPGLGTLNISGNAYLEGEYTGVEIRAGELNMTGGTVIGKYVPVEFAPNGSGTTVNGTGIAISQHTTNYPITVDITGGTIKGYNALFEKNIQNRPDSAIATITVNVSGNTNIEATNGGTYAIYLDDYALMTVSVDLSQATIVGPTYYAA